MLLKIVLVALLALLIQYVFKLLIMFDVHKRTYNHRPGACRKIEGPEHGSEDIAIVDELQLAFITSGLAYFHPDVNGSVFLYDLSQRTFKADILPIIGMGSESFNPHGISHWMLENGNVRLFVVNHSKSMEHSIVVLDFDKTARLLTYVKTVRDERFVRPNNLVATGDDSFLVSNDGGAQSLLGSVVEMLSGFYKGGLVYYDGSSARVVLKNSEANGVALSRDGKTLFVSHHNQEAVGVYEWDQQREEVTLKVKLDVSTKCDNFYIDKDDNLWAACLPVLKDTAVYLADNRNPSLFSQSQVLRLKFSSDRTSADVVEVFSDDGRFTCASTIATPFDNGRQLLIGTVARDLTHCDVDVAIDF